MALTAQTQPPAAPPQQPRQPSEIELVINGAPGLPPKIAVPDFIPLTNEPETVAAAKTIGQVLWDDLNFEREFYLIPRDTYRSIPPPTSIEQVPLDQLEGARRRRPRRRHRCARDRPATSWRCGCSNRQAGASAWARSTAVRSLGQGPRPLYAHTAADEIHQQQRALRGVARTKLPFTSDRDGERMKGPVADRGISNIYIVRLRRREPDAADRHALAGHHAGLVARRQRCLHLVAQRLPDIIVQYDGDGHARQKPAERHLREEN